jgi:hypothetical protein
MMPQLLQDKDLLKFIYNKSNSELRSCCQGLIDQLRIPTSDVSTVLRNYTSYGRCKDATVSSRG